MSAAEMTIILNPFASGGRAIKKWNALLKAMPAVMEGATLEILGGQASAYEIVREAFQRSEKHFVAAGGDGTVNLVLEALMKAGCEKEAALGAIGLGSSNDFHKPYWKEDLVAGVPMKIDFTRARPRDVGSFTFGSPERRRYFLVNASAGVTAEANDLFNNPGRLLAFQKRHATSAAIYYAALKTILTYRNRSLTIGSSGGETFRTSLTNLGILKSPYFSGSLSYGGSASYDDGLLKLYLCKDLNTVELIRLLRALSTKNGRRPAIYIRTWSSPEITLEARLPLRRGIRRRGGQDRFSPFHCHSKNTQGVPMMNAIKENEFISRLTAGFRRSPLQENGLQESDAEILCLPGNDPARIAVTIDTISEEISRGLYDPYLAGWMTVMASMSDLAAVGARPMGIVISETLPPDLSGVRIEELQKGIGDAADACGSYVLGGDTNSGERLLLTGCAIGIFGSEKSLSRRGATPGDALYTTNLLGSGNAFALSRLLSLCSGGGPAARLQAEGAAGRGPFPLRHRERMHGHERRPACNARPDDAPEWRRIRARPCVGILSGP